MFFRRLLLETEAEFGVTMSALMSALEDAHGLTVDGDGEAGEAMRLLRSVIKRLDPEAEILSAGLKAGQPFDWDAFYDSLEGDGDEEIEGEPDGDVSPVAPVSATQEDVIRHVGPQPDSQS